MKKALILAGAAVLALVSCNKNPESQPVDYSQFNVRIEPVITRATETNFENGDQIGLTILRAAGAYAENARLTYDGAAFSGDLKWYEEGTEASTLKAYYPYASTFPTSFTVAADQSAGTASSDFVSAVKEEVLPTANEVAMVFKHRLSRLVVTAQNNSGMPIESVVFKGIIPTATIADDLTATVSASAEAIDIKAFADGDKYYAIVPGQKVALEVVVTAGGKALSQKLTEATLEAGKQYSVSIIVNKDEIKVVLAGEIENWGDGGEISGEGSDEDFVENLEEGYFTYAGVKYDVVKMKDGKWWMAQNLAYLPEGYTPATELSAVTAGVFAPIQVNAAKTAAEFTTDPAVVAKNGYLYQAEVALGLKVGDLKSVEEAQALEGAQGICPQGWHVPTGADIIALVGKAVSPLSNNPDAPYYNGANGSISLLNADGFNMDAFGAVSIQDNTKTAGTFMGWASGYPDKISSGMFCGSTYASVTYNTSGDETSGVKNLQFFGFMPMTNKATEADYTCNGTKVSYRIAGPVRCVRD
ncbi:MAG: fimbrillin family protein [Bacteroidales bacterium]|nr:fimbrillin family protein [Bacteroidales bacterium]MBQ3766127.1 fimbrillin family protein [Bacteroidales bacterium]